MINPQQIDPLQLPSVPITASDQLPFKGSIIYWIIDADNAILRVGSLVHPRRGFRGHFYRHGLQRFPSARIAWLELPRYSSSKLRSLRNAIIRETHTQQVQNADSTRFSLAISRPLLEKFHSVLQQQGLSRAGTIARLIDGWLQQNEEATE